MERQLRCLDHRGPDSWGIYAREHVAVGQTRLSVIDLVTGDPPISNEDGNVGVALNGEIYNFQLLREELQKENHVLSTSGDTEVIAHLAEDLQPVDLARCLDGMFAFAVWDDSRHRLVLGRDRLGKKPLYYWHNGDRLVFGSEIKAVLTHPWVVRELDPDAIPAYLTFGYVPTPRSFFAAVVSVPPGHVVIFDRQGVHLEPYWEPSISPNGESAVDLTLGDAADQVYSLLEAAVRRRLVSDVPLGAFLSGGIDSSTIVAIMARISDQPVLTFTIGFEEHEGFDERPYARLVANRYRTNHTEFVVRPDAVDLIEELVWHHDQPFGDSSAIPTYLLSKLTRGEVKVALCGDGGDELFAGYERFAAALILEGFQRLPPSLRRLVRGVSSVLPAQGRGRVVNVRRFMERSELELFAAYLSWVSFFQSDRRERLLGRIEKAAIDEYWRLWESTKGADLLDRLLFFNLRTYLLDDLLPKMDRMSMAHGLEVRSPFLDRELVEFALRLPTNARVLGLRGKRVLRMAARELLPRELLHRRKQGFGIPVDRWFRCDMDTYIRDRLTSPKARVRSHLCGEEVEALVREHQAGGANHGHALWALLTLEVFLRREGW
ncbi:MAG: asparagine synthase (glutamine-hydrolyzing) [Actinomycetota bacterium]|nr:asparagine synthase (glutamine-hydrolyzing) [Actinomycetota bacterium]